MGDCSVCGTIGARMICDNSCGTAFCSMECSKKDTHQCSDCPNSGCHGSVLMQSNNLWKCNKCNFEGKEDELDHDDLETVVQKVEYDLRLKGMFPFNKNT